MNIFKREDYDRKATEVEDAIEFGQEYLSTGSKNMNDFIGGGLPIGFVTHVYGPPGSGKTNLCLSAAVECAKGEKKVLFIDTEGGFSVERLRQINKGKVPQNFYVKQPIDFDEQGSVIRGLSRVLDKGFGLVIVDSIVSLYRLRVCGDRKKVIELSRELGKELAQLSVLARKNKTAVVICNQVYNSIDGENEIVPVGGDVLVYWSKMILELGLDGKPNTRIATIRKHPFKAEGKSLRFSIVERGME